MPDKLRRIADRIEKQNKIIVYVCAAVVIINVISTIIILWR